jgi:hypothetical protein
MAALGVSEKVRKILDSTDMGTAARCSIVYPIPPIKQKRVFIIISQVL